MERGSGTAASAQREPPARKAAARWFGAELAIYALVTCVLLGTWAVTAIAGVPYGGQLWPWPLAMLTWGVIVVLHGRRAAAPDAVVTLGVNVVIYSVMNAVFVTAWEPSAGQPVPGGFPWPIIPIVAWGSGLLGYALRVGRVQPRPDLLAATHGSSD